ncbi:hypothetical protein [uncultured Tateyamaria sp.]|uniref:hypothetical protein n=1 Tax=uncultured Tateyamaria sp. TaxID=455651 RepID=UPI00260DE130|nr:hypothetical protein [uncultured Tateyamaria sp.]
MYDTGLNWVYTFATLSASMGLSLLFRIAVPKSFAWCLLAVMLISGATFAFVMSLRLLEFGYLISSNSGYGHAFVYGGVSPRALAFEMAKQSLLLSLPISAGLLTLMTGRKNAIWS